MTWKTKGKIGCHFPDRTGLNPNFDVTRVVYSQDGVVANVKEIEKVYYISPAAAEAIAAKSTHEERMAELAKWLVWQRYWDEPVLTKILSDFDGHVLIKYTPNVNTTLNSIGIVCSNNGTSYRCVYVFDNNGILIAKETNETINESIELYEFSGVKRTMTFSNQITLEANKTYWIKYDFEGASHGTTYFTQHPITTNGVYKELNSNDARNFYNTTPYDLTGKTVVDLSSAQYQYEMVALALNANENDIFKTPFNIYNPFQWGNAGWYRRTSTLPYHFWTIIAHTDNTDVSAGDLDNDADHKNKLFIVRKTNDSNPDTAYKVYRRTNVDVPTIPEGYSDLVLTSEGNRKDPIVQVLVAIDEGEGFSVKSNGCGNWPQPSALLSLNKIIVKQSGADSHLKFNSDGSPTGGPAPTDATPGDVYYHGGTGDAWKNTGTGDSDQYGYSFVIYLGNGQWSYWVPEGTYTINETDVCYFEAVDISNCAVDVTSTCANAAESINVPQLDISSKTTHTTTLHYLEINGNEVPPERRQ